MFAIVDCNSFYASCEKVFRPDLEGKPIAVLSNNDGCLIARNDEAKALGIGMGVPYFKVKELLTKNNVEVFSSNYPLYGDLSRRVMETILSIHPNIEVYSVDEAFLDLKGLPAEAIPHLCQHIRQTVQRWTGIPVSIGVGRSKVLAKVANRLSKKSKKLHQGVYVLSSEQQEKEALKMLQIEDVWGIGRQYSKNLRMWGIETAYQLSLKPIDWAKRYLGGVVGVRLVKELNGIPCIALGEGLDNKQMIASTRSFGQPVTTLSEMKEAIATYTCRAAEKLRLQKTLAAYISVFMKTNRFDTRAVYQSGGAGMLLPIATNSSNELIKQALLLAEQCFVNGNSYKKAGVILSMISPDGHVQGNLFDTHSTNPKLRELQATLDFINRKNGIDTIKYAATGTTRNWKMRSEIRSPEYTTKWGAIYKIGKRDVPHGT